MITLVLWVLVLLVPLTIGWVNWQRRPVGKRWIGSMIDAVAWLAIAVSLAVTGHPWLVLGAMLLSSWAAAITFVDRERRSPKG